MEISRVLNLAKLFTVAKPIALIKVCALGLEVSGHETPLLVGVSRNITCTTQLKMTRIEWLLDDRRTIQEEREDGGQTLVLSLTPKDTELNGTSFACEVTTSSGETFSETVVVIVKGMVDCL